MNGWEAVAAQRAAEESNFWYCARNFELMGLGNYEALQMDPPPNHRYYLGCFLCWQPKKTWKSWKHFHQIFVYTGRSNWPYSFTCFYLNRNWKQHGPEMSFEFEIYPGWAVNFNWVQNVWEKSISLSLSHSHSLSLSLSMCIFIPWGMP